MSVERANGRFRTDQTAVGVTSENIIGSEDRGRRRRVTIRQTAGSGKVYIGNLSTVNTGSGFEIPSTALGIPIVLETYSEIHAISDTAAQSVDTLSEYFDDVN